MKAHVLTLSDISSVEEKWLLEKIDVKESGECWPWLGRVFLRGYGKIYFRGRNHGAHRLLFQIRNQVLLTPEEYVCHKCDNPICCNPEHLFVGSPLDNALDMIRKGRNRPAYGDRNGSRRHPECLRRGINHFSKLKPECVARGERARAAKLTPALVREIRRRYVPRKTPQHCLAAEYGVTQMAICRIVRGENWKHVI